MKLFEELKRRKVLKTLGVYSAAAIIISQLVASIFPYLFLPPWTVTFVIVLIILGFPITFFLSWNYDLKQDKNSASKLDHNKGPTGKKWSLTKKIIFPVTGFILMAVGGIFWFIYPFLTISMGHDRDYDASIAILYMENISMDENNYFADGLTEELINRLSRIQNLKVRPRTDVAVFKNKTVPINEIAKDLSVNYIVEGSVQIAENKLRVHAKLFDIAQDKITWSDTYKRELTDFFDIQDDIASKIVTKLDEKLTITTLDLKATKRKSTENLEAYNLIMEAYEYINNPIYSSKMLYERTEPLAQEAIKLDSTYAEAYALLSLAKLFKWMDVPTNNNPELRKQKFNDSNKANFLAKTALQYDKDNLLAHAIITIIPFFKMESPDSEANELFIVRSMLIDAKMFLQKFPDALFSKYIYALILTEKIKLQGGEKEDFQEPLDYMLDIYQKLKRNNFVISHPTDGMVMNMWGEIARLYYRIGDGEKGMDFIIENKHYICPNGTYECLNVDIQKQIMEGFYGAYYYENALELINMILSKSEEELIAFGNTIDDKKSAYYKSGMIYMKLGQFDKAIEGFSQALILSYDDDETNIWWNIHLNRRLGLIYYFMGEHAKASNYYLEAMKLDEDTKDEEEAMRSICSYGYMEELKGNSETAKEKMAECSKWILENPDKLIANPDDPGYYVYETIWPLYLYNEKIHQQEEASKYLNMAYEIVGSESIDKFHKHLDKDTHPKFFYGRDIIKTYETKLNQ